MSGQFVERTTAPGAAVAGSIYDLGYQHYEGPRLGRAASATTLYLESVRACFGLGRPTRSKIVPVGLLVIALLPAVIAVAIEAIAGSLIPNPIRYDDYFATTVQILVLFVAAQAPELVGRDQRFHVLALYFSRPLARLDYALAKLAALVTALLLVTILPQAVIFGGKVLAGTDPLAAFSSNVAKVPPILFSSVSAAVVMGAIALAIGSYSPRRAYATAAIFAVFYITVAFAAAVVAIRAAQPSSYVVLISPTSVLEGLTAWSFDAVPNRMLREADLPGELYVVAAAVMAVVALAALARRYRRIDA